MVKEHFLLLQRLRLGLVVGVGVGVGLAVGVGVGLAVGRHLPTHIQINKNKSQEKKKMCIVANFPFSRRAPSASWPQLTQSRCRKPASERCMS